MVKKHIPDFVIDNYDLNNWMNRIDLIKSKKSKYVKPIDELNTIFSFDSYVQKCLSIYKKTLDC